MSENLVIVESPAKAKTIGKILGQSFMVVSSFGHVRDIVSTGKKNNIGIDFANGYAPNYEISPDKIGVVEQLKKETKKAKTVWLASDEDREGEAIAWHLKEVLQLADGQTKRIVFHEITKTAILNAIENPREIDYNLVDAQQARRVLDRIVGFELSPVLWKKVATGLSAGRVQSVAVRLIVDKENEIRNFKTEEQYKITADFINADGNVLRAELNQRFGTLDEARAFLEQCKNADFIISAVQKKPGKRTPAPPFTTSSLQQEASRKLRFPVAKTMRVAQRLYEGGAITYMRTDSYNLSTLALGMAKKVVAQEYGAEYSKTRQYTTSAKGAQEAHEAIRPTDLANKTIAGDSDEQRLYDLIWKRTMASQMADAQIETTKIEITLSNSPYTFTCTGEVILFDGFMRAYIQSKDDETDDNQEGTKVLPPCEVGQKLKYTTCFAVQTFTRPPYRYTEASLVKKMEELGIGRPSTYATIIETILARQYVVERDVEGIAKNVTTLTLKNGKITSKEKVEKIGADNRKMTPTDTGEVVTEFLMENFPEIMSYDFTAEEEKNFDDIAEGKTKWEAVVDEFYKKFHPAIEAVPAGRSASRFLGNDPQSGEPIYVKITKIGVRVQKGDGDEKTKPLFVELKKGQSYYSVTLDDALELLKVTFPYKLGDYAEKEMVICKGRFGPFISYDGKFISIPKTIAPESITPDEAIELIKKKEQQSIPLKEFGEIKIMDGRYGPYIKVGENNYKLPKGTDVASLREEDCKEIIQGTSPTNKKRSFARKRR